jgi:flagellar hook-associated protein 3 FlgL
MIRVTQLTYYRQLTKDILRQESIIFDLNDQLSSEKRIKSPSDDPMGTICVQDAYRTLDELDQYAVNVDFASTWINQSEDSISSLSDALAQAKELAEQMATGTYTSDEREAAAAEVQSIIEEIVNTLNVDVNGSYIFGGTANEESAVTLDLVVQNPPTASESNTAEGVLYGQGDYTGDLSTTVTMTVDSTYAGGVPGDPPGNDMIVNYSYYNDDGEEVTGTVTLTGAGSAYAVDILDEEGNATGIQIYAEDRDYAAGDSFSLTVGHYQGNSEDLSVNLSSNSRLTYSYTVDELLGSEGATEDGERKSILDNLISWANALENDGTDGEGQAASQDMLTTLESAMGTVLKCQADAGAKINRLETRQTLLEEEVLRMDERISEIESVDIAEATATLAVYNILYQAALAGMSMISNRSLADYL